MVLPPLLRFQGTDKPLSALCLLVYHGSCCLLQMVVWLVNPPHFWLYVCTNMLLINDWCCGSGWLRQLICV